MKIATTSIPKWLGDNASMLNGWIATMSEPPEPIPEGAQLFTKENSSNDFRLDMHVVMVFGRAECVNGRHFISGFYDQTGHLPVRGDRVIIHGCLNAPVPWISRVEIL